MACGERREDRVRFEEWCEDVGNVPMLAICYIT